jgi:hypothetical protein
LILFCRKKKLVDNEISDVEKMENTKAYRQQYYQKNRERLLERNKSNRATKSALAKVGIYTVGKKGRPAKKRADVDNDDDGGGCLSFLLFFFFFFLIFLKRFDAGRAAERDCAARKGARRMAGRSGAESAGTAQDVRE